MAWAIVARVLKTKVGSPSGKAVLLALANHCDEHGGNCYPSQEVIETLTELSVVTWQILVLLPPRFQSVGMPEG